MRGDMVSTLGPARHRNLPSKTNCLRVRADPALEYPMTPIGPIVGNEDDDSRLGN